MPREVKDINFNSGYNGCEARMSILKNETVRRDLDYDEIKRQDVDINSYIYVENEGVPSKIKLASIIDEKQGTQSDWLEEDTSSLAYIKNKPILNLDKDIVASYTVGGIKAGDKIPEGTSVYDLLIKILSIAESAVVRFGVLDSITNVNPQTVPEYTLDVQDVLTKGLLFENVQLQNQYYVLLIPEQEGLKVDRVFQGGYRLSTRAKTFTDANNKTWRMYYPSVPGTGVYTFIYKLIREA